MVIHIVIAVWGTKYLKWMTDYALPSLMYANNLRSVAEKHECVLFLYCKKSEEKAINEIPLLSSVRRKCQVEICNFDPDNFPHCYAAMGFAHHHAAVRAKKLAAKVVFYCPDGVMANGSLDRAVRLVERGKRAVKALGLRISESLAEQHLKPLIHS